ncbi:MAG: alpha/beta fold hydrolase [Clostridia bacterium]|nr:alpha/beta fold hydrolase [Clostridia bacterium]
MLPLFLYGLLGLVLLALAASFLLFCIVFARGGRREDFLWRRLERRGRDADAVQQMREGLDWYRSQTTRRWHIRSFDNTALAAEFLPTPQTRRGTVILCHGWRSSGPTDFAWVFREYLDRGFDLLVLHQRGHGASGGRWLGFGVLERRDLQCWVAEVCRRQGTQTPILLHGMSMGGATVQFALDLPLPDNVVGAVVDCGFSSPWEECAAVIRRYHLPVRPVLAMLDLWVRLLAGYRLQDCHAGDVMTRNRRPVLWLHGRRDGLVPCRMSQETYGAAVCPKWLVTVPGAGHELAWLRDPESCRAAWEAFLACCLPE